MSIQRNTAVNGDILANRRALTVSCLHDGQISYTNEVKSRDKDEEDDETVGEEVNKVTAEFYHAFESLSIEMMDKLWKHDENVVCIHPGWDLFTGWLAIQESWIIIFSNTLSPIASQYIDIIVTIPRSFSFGNDMLTINDGFIISP